LRLAQATSGIWWGFFCCPNP